MAFLPQRQNSAPGATDNERKLAILYRLGCHYWRQDFNQTQAKNLLLDYVEDLADFTWAEVETACREWRRDQTKTKFPRSAELAHICRCRRTESAAPAGDQRAMLPSRPTLWWLLPKDLRKPDWKES